MKRILFAFAIFAAAQCGMAQERVVTNLQLPMPTGIKHEVNKDDPSIQNLIWHTRHTDNFTILSLDNKQSQYMKANIEGMKSWVYTRWGLPDQRFSAECRVLCVPTKELQKKLFGLDDTYGEVRRDKSGKITLSILWLVLDSSPAETVPSALTVVALNEFEVKHQVKLGQWAHRGMTVLNGTVNQVKTNLGALKAPLDRNEQMFFGNMLLTMTDADYKKLTLQQRDLFDKEAAAVCLLLRKELGQKNLHAFMRTGGAEVNLRNVYGFQGYNEFDGTLKRYMIHLSNDILAGRTPDHYLKIKRAN